MASATLDQSGIVRRETQTILTHKGEILKSNAELVDIERHSQAAAVATKNASGIVPADGERRDIPHVAECAKAFEIGFKVTAECGDNFNSNDQIFITSEKHSLEIQILGPAYGSNQHKISAWFKSESGKGAHHKGIKEGALDFLSDSNGVPTGELMVGPITCGQEYACQFTKTTGWDASATHPLVLDARGGVLTLDCGGGLEAADTPSSSEVYDHATAHKFDLMADTTKLLLGLEAGSGDNVLHGQLADVTINCPTYVDTSNSTLVEVAVGKDTAAQETGKM